jgi:hypothetical protein
MPEFVAQDRSRTRGEIGLRGHPSGKPEPASRLIRSLLGSPLNQSAECCSGLVEPVLVEMVDQFVHVVSTAHHVHAPLRGQRGAALRWLSVRLDQRNREKSGGRFSANARAPSIPSSPWAYSSSPSKARWEMPEMWSVSALNECLRNFSAVGE